MAPACRGVDMQKSSGIASEHVAEHELSGEWSRLTSLSLGKASDACRDGPASNGAEADRALAAMLGVSALAGLGFWATLIYAAF